VPPNSWQLTLGDKGWEALIPGTRLGGPGNETKLQLRQTNLG